MYIGFRDGKIATYTQDLLDLEQFCLDSIEETDKEYVLADDYSEYILKPDDWEEQQAQKERDRINMLSLTAADVERALYKSRKIDFDDVIFMVEQYNKKIDDKKQEYLDELEKYNALEDEQKEQLEQPTEPKEQPIDIKALKIELKANNFYRGNPYLEQIGTLLGYTSEDLDYLFENGELPKEEKNDVC